MGQSTSNRRADGVNEQGTAVLRFYDPESTLKARGGDIDLIEIANEMGCEFHQRLERMRALMQSARATVARSRQLRRRRGSPARSYLLRWDRLARAGIPGRTGRRFD